MTEGFIIGVPTKRGIACYIFSEGDVELLLEPEGDTAAVGRYSGDESSGKISWAGGGHSEYSWNGARYSLKGAYMGWGTPLSGSRIRGCSPP